MHCFCLTLYLFICLFVYLFVLPYAFPSAFADRSFITHFASPQANDKIHSTSLNSKFQLKSVTTYLCKHFPGWQMTKKRKKKVQSNFSPSPESTCIYNLPTSFPVYSNKMLPQIASQRI